jgi:FMN phosphatase YigB (HAD superfamily)
MKKPKVIIYDNDGMIVAGTRFSEIYSKEFGVDIAVMTPFFTGKFKKCLTGEGDLKEELKTVLEDWKWNGTVEELMEYWFSSLADFNDEIIESIKSLKEQGAIVCLATNQEKYRTDYLIHNLGYDQMLDEVFSSAYLGANKVASDSLEKIEYMLNKTYGKIERDEIMFWDDRDENIESLSTSGINAQKYTTYESFKRVMQEAGYEL